MILTIIIKENRIQIPFSNILEWRTKEGSASLCPNSITSYTYLSVQHGIRLWEQ